MKTLFTLILLYNYIVSSAQSFDFASRVTYHMTYTGYDTADNSGMPYSSILNNVSGYSNFSINKHFSDESLHIKPNFLESILDDNNFKISTTNFNINTLDSISSFSNFPTTIIDASNSELYLQFLNQNSTLFSFSNKFVELPPSLSLLSDSILNFSDDFFKTKDYFDDSPIVYSGFVNRSESIYKGKNQVRYEFYDHELTNENGISLSLIKTTVSNAISPQLSASIDNGALITKNAIYKEEWLSSDQSPWLQISAPSPTNKATLTLFSSANLAGSNKIGEIAIDDGSKNIFLISANSSNGKIGWDSYNNTSLILNTAVIETNAEIRQNSVLKSKSIIVSDEDLKNVIIPEDIQAYFSSDKKGQTGLLIENRSTQSTSSASIIFKQQNSTGWIGMCSANSVSDSIYSNSLTLESKGNGGILFNALHNESEFSNIRFAIDSEELARISKNSLLLGTTNEDPSSILTIESHSRGVRLPVLTSKQIYHITNPSEGLTLYNRTKKSVCVYNGLEWRQLSSKKMKRLFHVF